MHRKPEEIAEISEHMIARARQLRRESTLVEQLLWGLLRDRRCAGLKFRRQQPVGPFVADFFCASARLVVELDGSIHEGQEAADEERQKYLEKQGLKVIRFTNESVLANLEAVAEEIAGACGRTVALPLKGLKSTLTRPCGPTSPVKGEVKESVKAEVTERKVVE